MSYHRERIEELVRRAIALRVGDVVLSLSDLDPIVDPRDGWVARRIKNLAPLKATNVTYYTGFGWLSSEELFDLRQTEPRIAP